MVMDLITDLQRFIQIPSYSGEEEEMAHLLESIMKAFHFNEIWIDAYGNVIGKKVGRRKGKTYLFDAHMDIVPVDESQWSCAPFGGLVANDRVWGRGSSDTKGSLAAMIYAIGETDPEEISGTVCVVGSVGEEICEGAALKKVVEQIGPDLVIVGEPTGCKIGIGQKGRTKIAITASGKPAHSAVPHLGENAVYKAAEIIRRIQQITPVVDPEMGAGIMELIDIISLPHPSQSTVPYECKMNYDRRLLVGETIESIQEIYTQGLKGLENWQLEFAQVRFKTYTGYEFILPDFHPAWRMELDSPLLKRVQNGVKKSGIEPVLCTLPFCTNGSSSAGELHVPTVVFGPSSGELAHRIDENIEISDLIRGYKGYQGIIHSLMID